jgi:hypothetical protein
MSVRARESDHLAIDSDWPLDGRASSKNFSFVTSFVMPCGAVLRCCVFGSGCGEGMAAEAMKPRNG